MRTPEKKQNNSRQEWLIGFMVFAICLISLTYTQAARLYSRRSGDWSTGTTWSTVSSTGASCGCTPQKGDIVTISHNVTFASDLKVGNSGQLDSLKIISAGKLTGSYDIDVTSGGYLRVDGMLKADDITFYNGSIIVVTSGASMSATGDFENRNNSDQVTINGSVTVQGDFTAGNGSVIIGNGNMYVAGTVSQEGTGEVFGCSTGDGCCSGGANCTIQPAALPVSWAKLEAKRVKDGVEINWVTASELNNDYFTIERAGPDGNFLPIARIKGAGTKLDETAYTFTDKTALYSTWYYRIKQTDFNLATDHSRTVQVKGNSAQTNANEVTEMVIFPNPASSGSQLQLKPMPFPDYSVLHLSIFDNMGRLLLEKREVQPAGGFILQLPGQGYGEGMYTVLVSDEAGTQLKGRLLILQPAR